MVDLGKVMESPYTALSAAIVFGALALSGRFSVTATQLLLVAAWGVAVVGLRGQPLPICVGTSAIIAGALIMLGYWFRPDAIPAYSGILTPKILFSASDPGTKPKLQIGNSGVFMVGRMHMIMPMILESQLKVELINKKMKVSTLIANQSGKIVVEIVRNEWKVAPPPGTWDRNYTNDALEVKNPEGHVILQVRALADRIQLQGAWPSSSLKGFTTVILRKDPSKNAEAQITWWRPGLPWPEIEPMFEYPSDLHFGELRRE